jgi:hypothetical protein
MANWGAEMYSDDLLTELEQLIRDARQIPLTPQVRIDPKAALALIDQIREALAAERSRINPSRSD